MISSTVPDLRESLDQFLRDMPMEVLARQLSARCAMTDAEAKTFLALYANETRTTLDLVADAIAPELKILEVGAGLCLFSLFLKKQGYNITALEPSVGGFGTFETAKHVLLEHYADLNLRVYEFPAQDLTTCQERFDLIFSNNVLEHIPNLEAAWSGMCAVLNPGGVLLHNCPNYFFPYEPHLGIPVFKLFPQLSCLLFRGTIARHKEVWDSLNFTTYFDIQKLAQANGMKVRFKKGLLWSALSRIGDDPLFRQRHSGSLIVTAYTILRWTHLLDLLRHIPPMFATPMIFQCSKEGQWRN